MRTIFLENWGSYRVQHKVRNTENENVLKMLSCRTPLLGKHIYECPECQHIVEVPHTCKSRFCSVCGYAATENWIRERFSVLLDCPYHHVVATIPRYFKWIVCLDQAVVLSVFAKAAAETLLEWGEQRGYRLGIICFYHAFNKHMQFHPHFHYLVTAGGIGKDGQWHYDNSEIPGHILMRKFKAKFVAEIRKLFKEGKLHTNGNLSRVLYQISHQHDRHWQFYTQRITREGTHTMEYCARYCKRMVISEMRIIDYNGSTVTFWDSKMKNVLEYDVETFIKLSVLAIPEKHFRLIRYYGFYANKGKKKYAVARKYWKPLAVHKEHLSWQLRQTLRNYNNPNYPKQQNKDPLKCPKCKIELKLKEVIYPEPKYKRTLENIKIILGIAVEQKLALNTC